MIRLKQDGAIEYYVDGILRMRIDTSGLSLFGDLRSEFRIDKNGFRIVYGG